MPQLYLVMASCCRNHNYSFQFPTTNLPVAPFDRFDHLISCRWSFIGSDLYDVYVLQKVRYLWAVGRPMCGLCLQGDKIGQPGQIMHSAHWNLWQRPILIRICFMYRNHSGYQEQTLGICIWKASLYLVRNRTINNRAWISGVSEFVSPLVGRSVGDTIKPRPWVPGSGLGNLTSPGPALCPV